MFKPSKFRNKKTVIDGITFDSLKEGKRYRALKMLERAGKITDLKLQPKFLIANRVEHNGNKYQMRYYIADFQYCETGTHLPIVEDVKSAHTIKDSLYTLKRLLFLTRHGDRLIFKEVL